MKHFKLSCLHHHFNFIRNSVVLCSYYCFKDAIDIHVSAVTTISQISLTLFHTSDSGFPLLRCHWPVHVPTLTLWYPNVRSLMYFMMIMLMIVKIVEAHFNSTFCLCTIIVNFTEKIKLGRNCDLWPDIPYCILLLCVNCNRNVLISDEILYPHCILYLSGGLWMPSRRIL